jgi:chaperonin cofactor prefoldin
MNYYKAGLFLFFSVSVFSLSGETDDASIIAAASSVASGNASAQDEALLFMNNKRLNHLAMEGRLDKDAYQKAQRNFDLKNRELASAAAQKAGMKTSGDSKTIFKPGTDTDVQLDSADSKLSSDDVANARRAYSQEVEAYLKDSGVKNVKSGENWAKKLDTDIMPSPDKMKSPEEFRKSAEYINGDGGNMYKDPKAASVQLKIGNSSASIEIEEANAYAKEMQGKVSAMRKEKSSLKKELKQAKSPQEKSFIENEIRKCESHEGKYIDRINTLSSEINKKYGYSQNPSLTSSGDKAISEAMKRDSSKSSINNARTVDAISEHLTSKAMNNYNETLAEIGKNSSFTSKSQQAVAENLKSMKPAQQSSAINDLELKFGKDYTKGVVLEMKKKTVSSGPSKAEPVAGVLGVTGTVISTYNDLCDEHKKTNGNPDYGKFAVKTAIDVSPAGKYYNSAKAALYEATVNTVAYRKELEDEYLKGGEDMRNFSTQFKIWAQATAYGSTRGAYQLAHAVPVVGDLLSGAETTANLIQETGDTINTLEVARGNIQEQDMNQKVTVAKSVLKGKKLAQELKQLSVLAASQRAEIERICSWTREFSMYCMGWKTRVEETLKVLAKTSEEKPLSPNAALKLLRESKDRLDKEFKGVKAVSDYHISEANKILNDKKIEITPQLRSRVNAFLAEHISNFARLASAAEDMNALPTLFEQGASDDKALLVSSIEESRRNILMMASEASLFKDKLDKLSAARKETVKKYGDARNALEKAYDFFWKSNNIGSAEWESIKADYGSVKSPEKDDVQACAKTFELLGKIPGDIKNYTAAINLPKIEDPQAADSSLAAEGSGIMEFLKKPYADAADSLNRAKSVISALDAMLSLPDKKDDAPGKKISKAMKQATSKINISASPIANISWRQFAGDFVPFRGYEGYRKELPEGTSMYGLIMQNEEKGSSNSNKIWTKLFEAGTVLDNGKNIPYKINFRVIAELHPPYYMPTGPEDFAKKIKEELNRKAKQSSDNVISEKSFKDYEIIFSQNKKDGDIDGFSICYPFKIWFRLLIEGENFYYLRNKDWTPSHKGAANTVFSVGSQITDKLVEWMKMRVAQGPGIKGLFYPYAVKDLNIDMNSLPSALVIKSLYDNGADCFLEKKISDRHLVKYRLRIYTFPMDSLDDAADAPVKKAEKKMKEEVESFAKQFSASQFKSSGVKDAKVSGSDESVRIISSSTSTKLDVLLVRKGDMVITVYVDDSDYDSRSNEITQSEYASEIVDMIITHYEQLPHYCDK